MIMATFLPLCIRTAKLVLVYSVPPAVLLVVSSQSGSEQSERGVVRNLEIKRV